MIQAPLNIMNKEQINKLKNKLKENKTSLESQLQSFAQKDNKDNNNWDARYPEFDKGDLEEKADAIEEYASLLPIERALETKLKNINDALQKIKDNSYGRCEKCNKDISYEELSITPETKNCRHCDKRV